MSATLFISLSAIGLVLVSPLVSPLIVWHLGKRRGVAVASFLVQRHLLLSGIVILILGLGLSRFSFHENIGNIAAAILASFCYLSLIVLSFSVRPRLIGWSIGIASSAVASVAFLVGTFIYSVDDNRQYAKSAGPELRCEVSYFGWGGSASGTKVKLIKSYFGIDNQVRVAWFVDGQDTPPFTTNEGACTYMLREYHG